MDIMAQGAQRLAIRAVITVIAARRTDSVLYTRATSAIMAISAVPWASGVTNATWNAHRDV